MTHDVPGSHPDLAHCYDAVRQELEERPRPAAPGVWDVRSPSARITVGKALRFTRGIHPLTRDRWVYTATDGMGRTIFGEVIHGRDASDTYFGGRGKREVVPQNGR